MLRLPTHIYKAAPAALRPFPSRVQRRGVVAALALIAALTATVAGHAAPVVSLPGDRPALRTDGGPEESAVAAAISSPPAGHQAALRPDGGPEESATAATAAAGRRLHFRLRPLPPPWPGLGRSWTCSATPAGTLRSRPICG